MDKPRKFFKHTFHHLYNRGANKENIFFERKNYLFFLERLRHYKDKYSIELLAYCLMPNHFHIFTHQLTEEGVISDFISSLINSYSKSINKEYKRSGTLFQGKIKSQQIEDVAYFKWVIKYILENLVKAGMVKEIGDWEFSNAKDILGLRQGTLTDVRNIIKYFDDESQIRNFLTDDRIKVNYEI
ncbi:MAG: transposase [Ignavibacteriaceae bacterium]